MIGAGKAAASMARVVEGHWPAAKPFTGLVVIRYGHGIGPLKRIEVVEAVHPVPDAGGRSGGRKDSRARQRPGGRRPRPPPDLGRRLGPPVAARARNHACGQAGAQHGAAQERRRHPRDQLRPQASLGDQGGQARGRRRAGPGSIIDPDSLDGQGASRGSQRAPYSVSRPSQAAHRARLERPRPCGPHAGG